MATARKTALRGHAVGLRQGKVLIRNWHGLNWETEEKLARKKTVDKRGTSMLVQMAPIIEGKPGRGSQVPP